MVFSLLLQIFRANVFGNAEIATYQGELSLFVCKGFSKKKKALKEIFKKIKGLKTDLAGLCR